MIKFRRETKIGIVATLAIAMLFWGLNFLRGKNVFNRTAEFHAIYNRIDGLSESSIVLVNGFKVGDVYDIKLLTNRNNSVMVSFDLNKDFPIPIGTIAEITSTDLMGSKAINLKFPDSVNGYHQENDTLNSVVSSDMSEAISEIKIKAENTISSLDSILISVNSIFDNSFKNNLQQTIANLNGITNALHHQLAINGELNNTLKNISIISDSIRSQSKHINAAIENIATISDSLANAPLQSGIENLEQTLNGLSILLTGINNGEGTLGQFAKNDSLYRNLNQLSYDLDVLIKDLNEHPKKYVHFSLFGKKDK